MHLFLYGPPASGKTSAGKILAEALSRPFIDLDAQIEQETSSKIPDLILQDGEEAFRMIESRLLNELSNTQSRAIIALGGGALLNEENRIIVEETGVVFLLKATPKELINRLQNDPLKRPLLESDLEMKLKTLLQERKNHYESFPLKADANGSPEQTAWAIQKCIGQFQPHYPGGAYDVLVQNGSLKTIGAELRRLDIGESVLILTDSNVGPLYIKPVLRSLMDAGFKANYLTIPAGEESKNIDQLQSIWSACLENDLDRNSTILALGGGVVSDLAGFAAATFMRGCNWAAVPTSLLAMVDASLGGKTGIDLPEGKNLAGAFYPPLLVLADTEVLSTLPERELRSGLAEVVKHGLISDPDLFDLCGEGYDEVLSNSHALISTAMAVKVRIIENDPYERGERASLNLGHTIGHAVEKASGYTLLHGEAVAIGLALEARLAENLGLCSPKLVSTIRQTLAGLHLPIEIPPSIDRAKIYEIIRMDKKKRDGVVHFALPEKPGVVRTDIHIPNLKTALEEIL